MATFAQTITRVCGVLFLAALSWTGWARCAEAASLAAPFGDADVSRGALLPDGEWWLERTAADGKSVFTARRLNPVRRGEKPLRALLRAEWPDARDIAVADYPALAARTANPAQRHSFLTGENGNTRVHRGITVHCDEWTFLFALSTPDAAAVPGALRSGDMDAMLLSLDFLSFDKPSFKNAVKVYLPDSMPREDAGNEIMTSLIRIKRIADPERGVENAAERAAYRYDGVAMISLHGLAVHRFAFGADSPEKFTAERHFGVARDGTVYEMDIAGGGQYEELPGQAAAGDDDIPHWWGEYSDGERSIRIGNFREGPGGYYFRFHVLEDGREIGEGFATVDDREAFYCGTAFTLSEDNDTLAVAPAPDADPCGDASWLRGCAGIYRR